jgi:6,7-dimethyl-8-ribityllumazine synthase
VASRYNALYVNAMVRMARQRLELARADSVRVVRVPGAFEIPIVAARLARLQAGRPDAIICLGVIIRGETAHADLIGTSVTRALTELQISEELPVIHEVLLLDNIEQARVRCLGESHNRGAEAASTAIAMVRLMRELK